MGTQIETASELLTMTANYVEEKLQYLLTDKNAYVFPTYVDYVDASCDVMAHLMVEFGRNHYYSDEEQTQDVIDIATYALSRVLPTQPLGRLKPGSNVQFAWFNAPDPEQQYAGNNLFVSPYSDDEIVSYFSMSTPECKGNVMWYPTLEEMQHARVHYLRQAAKLAKYEEENNLIPFQGSNE